MRINLDTKAFIILTFLHFITSAQSIKILNLKLDSYSSSTICQNVLQIDTIRYDSTFSCKNDTCVWNYSEKVDSNQFNSGCVYSFRFQLSFDIFDSRNSEIILYGVLTNGMSAMTYHAVIADSTTGDTLTSPGYGKKVNIYIASTSKSFMNIILCAKRVDGSDSTNSFISGNFSTEIKSPVTQIKYISIPNEIQGNFLLNGRCIGLKNKINSGIYISNKRKIIKK
ncbi:MAG TPA: hypothetical protein VHO70_03285 [Chitinispirillaceae bacterium]|nr:hypothetical protein [Chitinispirillaceae bacterium]